MRRNGAVVPALLVLACLLLLLAMLPFGGGGGAIFGAAAVLFAPVLLLQLVGSRPLAWGLAATAVLLAAGVVAMFWNGAGLVGWERLVALLVFFWFGPFLVTTGLFWAFAPGSELREGELEASPKGSSSAAREGGNGP